MITRKRLQWFFIILVLVWFAAPYLVNLDIVRTRVEKTTGGAWGITSHIGDLNWQWFPSPGLVFENVTLDHSLGHAHVAEAILLPRLGALFKGSIEIRSIHIVEPDIGISSLDSLKQFLVSDENKDAQPRRSFYPGTISVTVLKGRVSAPWSGSWEDLNRTTPSPEFSDITLVMDIRGNHLSLKESMSPSYAETCILDLDLTIDDAQTMRWDLDVHTKSPSYTSIRSIFLHAFPKHQALRNILGTMIPDGVIQSGSFRFTGTTDQWSDISRMNATAQVDRVKFRIPDTDLVLENTTGSLSLATGILSGRDLATRYGESEGRNGAFSLDLGKTGSTPFSLAMDLSADVSNLPPVLDTFLPDGEVKKELASLQDLKGKAEGRLTLDGDLSHLGFGVAVQDISASCFVPRISQPATITKGALAFSPSAMTWTDVAAQVGHQHIHNTSGRLDWEGTPGLTITSFSATVDSEELYPYLVSDPTLGPQLEPRVTSVSGLLDIRSLNAKGPFNNPNAWTVNGQLSTMGTTLVSPSLPGPLTLISPGVRFTEHSLSTRNITARMGEQMLRITASWEPGHTRADLYGTVKSSSASWLKENGWIPDAVFPRLPCDLDPLSLTWTGNDLAVQGLIIHRDEETLPMTTRLDMTVNASGAIIRDLSIDDGKQNARITARIPKDLLSGEIQINIEGAVSSTSLARVITNHSLPKGNMSGHVNLVYPLDHSKPPLLAGDLQITQLVVNYGDKSGLSLSQGKFQGRGKQASFDLEGLTVSGTDHAETSFQALAGNLVFLPGPEADVSLSSGSLCGIGLSGDIRLPSLTMDMQFNAAPEQALSLKDLTRCLGIKDTAISGHVSCDASVQGTPGMIDQGRITIRARDGVIQKAALFSKILALLDLTELFKANSVKNLLTEGYRYDSMDIDATITGHNMHISRAKIIGAGVNFYATGYVDLKNRSLDLYVLASPFKTVDNLVNRIPVIGKVMGGKNKSVLSVPVKVEGHLDNPHTRILPKTLSKASSSLLDAFAATFKLPFQLTSDLVNKDDGTDTGSPEKAE